MQSAAARAKVSRCASRSRARLTVCGHRIDAIAHLPAGLVGGGAGLDERDVLERAERERLSPAAELVVDPPELRPVRLDEKAEPPAIGQAVVRLAGASADDGAVGELVASRVQHPRAPTRKSHRTL